MTAEISGPEAPNWYAATGVAAEARDALANDVDVDVCVIGAGLAGLTIAYELARTGWSVALLEAGRVGGGASGRAICVAAPGFHHPIEQIVARVGKDRAKTLWALASAGVEQVRRTIAENDMPGVAPIAGRLVVHAAEADIGSAADLLRNEFATEVEAWQPDRVHAMLSGERHGPALHFPTAFHIHPHNYAVGLAGAAEKFGARIFERTRALSIDGEGVRKHVLTAGGRVRAAQIVLAPGGDRTHLHPLLDGTAITLSRSMAVTAPLGEQLGDVIGFAGVIEHAGQPSVRYHKIDDRLLWQGPLATARVATRGATAALRRQIRRAYPQFGKPALPQSWIAPLSCAVHGMPQIGQLAPGLWLAAAFGDHGVNVAAMAGDLIARGAREGDDRWRLFTPYGLVWTGGRAGRTVVALALKTTAATAWLRRRLPRRPVPPAAAPVVEPVMPVEVNDRPSAAIAPPPDIENVEAVVENEPAAAAPAAAELLAPADTATAGETTSGAVAAIVVPAEPIVTVVPQSLPVATKKTRRRGKAKRSPAVSNGEDGTQDRTAAGLGRHESPAQSLTGDNAKRGRKHHRQRRGSGKPAPVPSPANSSAVASGPEGSKPT